MIPQGGCSQRRVISNKIFERIKASNRNLIRGFGKPCHRNSRARPTTQPGRLPEPSCLPQRPGARGKVCICFRNTDQFLICRTAMVQPLQKLVYGKALVQVKCATCTYDGSVSLLLLFLFNHITHLHEWIRISKTFTWNLNLVDSVEGIQIEHLPRRGKQC